MTQAERWLARQGLDEDERRDIFEQFGAAPTCRKRYAHWRKIVAGHLKAAKESRLVVRQVRTKRTQ